MLHLAAFNTLVFPSEGCSALRVQAGSGQSPSRCNVVLSSQRPRKRSLCRARSQQEPAGSARPADPQEQELAEADFEAKQSLYAQLLDRQRSSQPSETSSSGRDQANVAPGLPVPAVQASTELIFRLERRGEGWGEEIFPHLVVEQRPLSDVKKRDRNRSSRPRPWTGGSAEVFLRDECGIAESKVDGIIKAAVAWRVTPGGRLLIDRRRRSRIERNMFICADYLVHECGIEPGSKGVGAIFTRVPQVMLFKPSTNDRWDRRVVQLAAFMHHHGHCNVPEDWEESPDLAKWVGRQRVARAQGGLSEERLQVLYAMGFEFGEVAQLTDAWEAKFDQLIEWVLWQDEDVVRKAGFSWLGIDWGRRGGLQARELALWVQLQREFQRRSLLSSDAVRRLDAIGFTWKVTDGDNSQHRWMHQLGRLLYIVERNLKINAAATSQQPQTAVAAASSAAQQSRSLQSPPRLESRAAVQSSAERPLLQPVVRRAAAQPISRGFPPPFPSRYSPQGSKVIPQPAVRQASSKGNALQRHIAKRRAALASAQLEAGQGFWLAKQRWLWRRGRLPHEQFLMLQLAGVEMDIDPPLQWQQLAHEAAAYLHGSQLQPDQSKRDGTPRQPLAKAPPISQSPVPRSRIRQSGLQYPQSLLVPSQASAEMQHGLKPIAMHALPVPRWQAATAMQTTGAATWARPSQGLHFLTPATPDVRASSTAQNGAASAPSDPPVQQQVPSEQQTRLQSDGKALNVAQDQASASVARGQGSSLYARTPPGRPPGRRCAVVRWVLNQRALWYEQRLTPQQLQYMTILGLTWLLSNEVVHMAEYMWLQQLQSYSQLLSAASQRMTSQAGPVSDWLLHQQGLFALGFLQPNRVRKLEQVGVNWQPACSNANKLWDARLTQLICFRKQYGHVQVQNSPLCQELASWLAAQCHAWTSGLLAPGKADQLRALGVKLPDKAPRISM